jgi:periplasmic protein CpxP/Spy
MSNIDEQVKVLSDHLNLNQDQQTRVRSILLDQHDQAMALIQDNSMERQAKIDKIHNLRTVTIDKVRQVLTSDQRPRFDEMVQQQDDRMRQRQEQNGAGTSNAPSSNPPAGTPPTSPNKPPR